MTGRQAVDLVDEQDVAAAERGEDAGRDRLCAPARVRTVTRASVPISWAMTWARVVLPRPGGPESSTWSRVPPRLLGGRDVDGQVVGDLALADELARTMLGRRAIVVVLVRHSAPRRDHPLGGRSLRLRLRRRGACGPSHFLLRAASACLTSSAAGVSGSSVGNTGSNSAGL